MYIQLGVPVPIARSRTFRSGNSEAIRLPRDVAFGEDVELVIVRSGDVMTIYPAATTVPEMLARLRELPAPSYIEQRDDEELTERPGI
jgi:antitoxin VapB